MTDLPHFKNSAEADNPAVPAPITTTSTFDKVRFFFWIEVLTILNSVFKIDYLLILINLK
tara:strand:- start:3 stop:182 length:180 start_codon:yes stop_codon:yes gene_type:complete